ncbi:hypothetical protein ACFQ2B_16695 [Streptomyces stramineus]
MEDSGGRVGVDLTAFGVYRMPWKSYQYGIEPGMNPGACPVGDSCGKDIRADGKRAWTAAEGAGKPGSSTSSSTSPPEWTSPPPGRSSAR